MGMISTPTVLILGAGASQPYEYPTGEQLQDYILDGGLDDMRKEILLELKSSGINLKKFLHALRRARLPSIDSFLEHRKEFEQIGKIAITKAIIDKEIENNLNNKDWYQHLFRYMFTSFDDFDKNKLSIVTFNYDRSLEHYLFEALRSSSGKSKKECAEKLSKIPIVHVHGEVGNLPWKGGKFTRPYQSNVDAKTLIRSSEGIRIVHESDADKDKEFVNARKLIASADRIFFLGFGYHKENLARLKIDDLPSGGREVLGTSYNMTDKERKHCRTVKCFNKIRLPIKYVSGEKVLGFLREHVIL